MASAVTPYEILGLSPTASPLEITAAYRILAQIYHPDRLQSAPGNVQEEAARRMRELNEAYAFASKGTPTGRNFGRTNGYRPPATRQPSQQPPKSRWADISFEQAQRERARAAAEADAAKRQREAAAVNGNAVARMKPRTKMPVVVAGMGEALVSNKIPCKGCSSIQWLPQGWKDTLSDTIYFCSICDRLLLCRVDRERDWPTVPSGGGYGY